ncbi:NAD(P)(+) transhydrogenase (Re/Si-specific) subunit beta [Haliangium sp.]|uniref:NAD(P)(+) transhydrogenase (Re/Si-specific) subunit beta n=1 Tax=Haliangium sp. TaxID=2663208 RepID=UPI003D0DA03D
MGLKGLTHPKTAVRGNVLGGLGMLVAVVAVLFEQEILGIGGLLGGLAAGTLIGALFAVRVQMTAMPQLVAIFNGFGGAASALVAAGEYVAVSDHGSGVLVDKASYFASLTAQGMISHHAVESLAIGFAGLVGAATFTGSVIAFAKLQELISGKVYNIPGNQFLTMALTLGSLGMCGYMLVAPSVMLFWLLIAVASVLGIALVLRIGGADMPVVIALLNSLSGIAAAAAGFVLANTSLIIAGSLVGASGVILTVIMCKAMNRSLANVLFGGVAVAAGDQEDIYTGKIKETDADEVAILLDAADRVVFVPGYGMAVAQAQHAVRELTNQLKKRGKTVEFAIHPVAGRMPGHMNVLLAEVDIPYDDLKEMEEINPTFGEVDVAIVLGANDVVNPVARDDPDSPIAGMPIIDVDRARNVIVIKRSLSPGFAGIPNPLFANDNTLMFFGDAKGAIMSANTALEEY